MVTITAKDFGPIVEGTVDLKPLTIFMGRSNTGKSFMATGIFALMTALIGDESALYSLGMGVAGRHFFQYRKSYTLRAQRDRQNSVAIAMGDFFGWLKSKSVDDLDFAGFSVSDLPDGVQELIESSVHEYLESLGESVIQRLVQTYGESSGFVRRGPKPRDPRLSMEQDCPRLHLDVDLSDDGGAIHEFDISDVTLRTSLFEDLPIDAELGEEDEYLLFHSVFNTLVSTVIEQSLASLPHKSFYLPAARSGIAQGHKVLAASLVRQSRRIGLEPVNIPTLPGIATEFLSHIIGLDRRLRARPKQVDLREAIDFIEKEVLQGKVSLDESAGLPYPEIVYEQTEVQPSPGTFTLDHTSSMVSELAPLVLFLKYLVAEENLLILEEPESHLHPGAQRQMARGIARLVNAGIRVIITTHSDMLVAQINNLLRLSYASSSWLKEHDFQTQDCLRREQIGAFLFHHKPQVGGSVISPLEVNPETGIDEEEFLREIELVYDETIELQRTR